MRRSFQARKFHFTYSSSPSLRCSSCRASGIGQSPVHRSKSITSNFLTLAARYISTVSFVWPRRHPQFTLIHLRLFEGVTIPIPLQQQFWRKFGARTARLPYSAAMCHRRFVWARFQTNYSDYGLLPLPTIISTAPSLPSTSRLLFCFATLYSTGKTRIVLHSP
jgi:hypothetical protein